MTSFFGVLCYWLPHVLQLPQLARSLSLTSSFWSTLLLVATGATGAEIVNGASGAIYHFRPLLWCANAVDEN